MCAVAYKPGTIEPSPTGEDWGRLSLRFRQIFNFVEAAISEAPFSFVKLRFLLKAPFSDDLGVPQAHASNG